MADRVNTKFVVLLIVTVVSIVGVFAVGKFFFFRATAAELVERGDLLLNNGDVEKAIDLYGRAINKKKTDPVILLRYADAVDHVKIKDAHIANNYIRQQLGCLSELVTHDPANKDHFERLMRMYMRFGTELGAKNSWDSILDRTDKTLENQPDHTPARKYRGIAQVNRLGRIDLDAQQRERCKADLEFALQENPQDRELLLYLAQWHLWEADTLDQPGVDPQRPRQHRDEANRLTKESLDINPDDIERQLDRLTVLLDMKEEHLDEITRLSREIENGIHQNPPPVPVIIRCAGILNQAYRAGFAQDLLQDDDTELTSQVTEHLKTSMQRLQQLYLVGVEAHPGNVRLMLQIGKILSALQQYDEAKEWLKRAYEVDNATDVFNASLRTTLQSEAKLQYAHLLLTQATTLQPQQREETLAEAEGLIRQVESLLGNNGFVNLELGQLAVLRGNWQEASAKFEQANTQFGDRHPQSLFKSAKVWNKLGQPGAAVERLEKLLNLNPRYMAARYELIQTYLKLHDFESAQAHIALILRQRPDDQRALHYKAQLLASTDQLDRAIEIYKGLDPKENPQIVPQLSRFYLAAGKKDEALALLEQRFNEDPTDLGTLSRLVSLTSDDREHVATLIQTSREAGADLETLEILERTIENNSDSTQIMEEVIERENDPVRRALKRFQLYRSLGKDDEARAELAKAGQLDPDDVSVIEAQFEMALIDEQWKLAETLTGKAASLNADMAEGMFYYGRLSAAREDYPRAIDSYRRGLELRPIYADGWRMLGMAQRSGARLENAADSFRESLKHRPNDARSMRELARVYEQLGQHGQALEMLRRAVSFQPRSRTLQTLYLAYETRHGDPDKAMRLRQTQLEKDPENDDNRRNLALLHLKAGDIDKAQEIIDPLIQLGQPSRESVFIASAIRAASDDTQGGRKLIQDYVNSLGEDVNEKDWLTLANYLISIQQPQEAAAAFRQAIAIEDPESRLSSKTYAHLLFDRKRYEQAAELYADLWEADTKDFGLGLRYVETLFNIQRLDQADNVLKRVFKEHGENETGLLLKARITQAFGKDDQALQILNRVVGLAPRDPKVYFHRAELLYPYPSQEPAVIDDLNLALEIDPDFAPASMLMADLHVRRGDATEAISVLRTVLNRIPRNQFIRQRLVLLYRETNQQASLQSLLDETAKLYPQEAFWVRLQAEQAVNEGKSDLAVRYFQKAFDLESNTVNLTNLADAQVRAGRPRQALELLREHSEMVNNNPVLKALRGLALAKDGSDDQVEAAFTSAIEACGDLRQVVLVQDKMVLGIGAEKTRTLLLQLAQDNPYGLIELALAQMQMDKRDYKLARWWIDRVESRMSDASPLKLDYDRILGLLLYYEGRYKESLDVYQNAIEQHPDDLMILNNAAHLLTDNLGRSEEALPLVKRAMELSPNNPLILDTLGWTLFKNGDVESGLSALRRSARIRPTAVNSLHLGEVLMLQGENETAEFMLQQARQLAEQSDDQKILLAARRRLEELNQANEVLQ